MDKERTTKKSIRESDVSVDQSGESSRSNMRATNKINADHQHDRNILSKRTSRSIICLRFLTVVTLVVAAILVCVLTYIFAYNAEVKEFENQYYDTIVKVEDAIKDGLRNKVNAAKTLSAVYTSHFGPDNVWPNATMPNFDERSDGQLALSNSLALSFNPIIYSQNRDKFESHAALNGDLLGVTQLQNNYTIYRKENGLVVDDPGVQPNSRFPDVMVPVYQIYPAESNWRAIMFNLHSEENRMRALDDMLTYKVPTLTALLHLVQHPEGMNPSSILFYPVFSDFERKEVTGSISIVFAWEAILQRVLPDYIEGFLAVLESSVSTDQDPTNGLPHQLWTYEISGGEDITYEEGDLHNHNFHRYEYEVNASVALEGIPDLENVDNLITFKVRLYPSQKMMNNYLSKRPVTYTIVMFLIFVFVSMIFFIYDYLHARYQKKIITFAKKSDEIMDTMFPISVKDRIFDEAESINKLIKYQDNYRYDEENCLDISWTGKISNTTLTRRFNIPHDDSHHSSKKERLTRFLRLPSNRRSSDGSHGSTLCNINTPPIADSFPETTVMFADIVGFTKWSADHEPENVFHLLESLFLEFDKIAHRLGVFKIGTVGDCYLAVTGVPDHNQDHAVIMCLFAHECRLALKSVFQKLEDVLGDVVTLSMRFGINSGPITAGVLRGYKSRFELFGDTINTASRMESTSKPQMIQISQSTADYLIEAGHSDWFEPRADTVYAKGKGELQTFWLCIDGSKTGNISDEEEGEDETRGKQHSYQSIIYEENSEGEPEGDEEEGMGAL
jgi:class 3 adenylate cyclase